MVMKSVGIAELKARLSRYLLEVRRGRSLIVMDRQTPIARIIPHTAEGDPLVVRRPLRRVKSLQSVPLPPPLKLDVDIVEILREERQGDR